MSLSVGDVEWARTAYYKSMDSLTFWWLCRGILTPEEMESKIAFYALGSSRQFSRAVFLDLFNLQHTDKDTSSIS